MDVCDLQSVFLLCGVKVVTTEVVVFSSVVWTGVVTVVALVLTVVDSAALVACMVVCTVVVAVSMTKNASNEL